jgi:hypothetical protein
MRSLLIALVLTVALS